MKVLVVHNFHRSGSASGDDQVFKHETAMLKNAGIELLRYTIHTDEFDKKNKAGKLLASLDMFWSPKTYRDIQRICKEEKPDIVHVHTFFPLLSPAVFVAAHRSGVKVIQTLHDTRYVCPNASSICNGELCTLCTDGKYFRMVSKKCFKNSKVQSLAAALIFGVHRWNRTFYRNIDRYIYLNESQKALFLIIKKCATILDFLESKSLWLGRFIFVLAAGVGVYTGFLLSAIQTYPLFNSPILPILFLASGISSGIAACIFFGILCFSKDISKDNTKTLLMADLRVIPIELLLLCALFLGLYFQGGDKAIIAVASLSSGSWAFVFWLGVIGLGIATPTLIALTALKNHAYKVNFILLNSLAVMIGVFALRMFILYAGQLLS